MKKKETEFLTEEEDQERGCRFQNTLRCLITYVISSLTGSQRSSD